jgi:hypothetical protein
MITGIGVAFALLGLRHHVRELEAESVNIYDQIRDRHHTLLDQRAEIAGRTNPRALASSMKDAGIDTGGAFQTKDTMANRPAQAVPAVETDLVAPLLNDGGGVGPSNGHANPNRPRQ